MRLTIFGFAILMIGCATTHVHQRQTFCTLDALPPDAIQTALRMQDADERNDELRRIFAHESCSPSPNVVWLHRNFNLVCETGRAECQAACEGMAQHGRRFIECN